MATLSPVLRPNVGQFLRWFFGQQVSGSECRKSWKAVNPRVIIQSVVIMKCTFTMPQFMWTVSTQTRDAFRRADARTKSTDGQQ